MHFFDLLFPLAPFNPVKQALEELVGSRPERHRVIRQWPFAPPFLSDIQPATFTAASLFESTYCSAH
jgi:hypothetical protein